jgi:hypothetical protein
MGNIIMKNDCIENGTDNIKPEFDLDKSLSQNAKEAVKFNAALNTLKDSEFVGSVENEIKGSILESTKADRKIDRIEKSAEVLDKETIKNENYYKKHKPVLNFGGIDEGCDLSIMKITFFLMILPYFLTAIFIKTPLRIIATVFEEFNKLLLAIAGFSKSAKLFCFLIIWTGIAVAVLLIIIKGAEYVFKTDILGVIYGTI